LGRFSGRGLLTYFALRRSRRWPTRPPSPV